MSLGIAFKGAEGIVLAADSRVTLTNERQANGKIIVLPATFDNAVKLLHVPSQKWVGAVTFGLGALGTREPRTAASFLPEFEKELEGRARLSVEAFASLLSDFYMRQYKAHMPAGAQAQDMVFLVGGYDEGAAYGKLFSLSVPSAPVPTEQQAGQNFGAIWGGQKNHADRLIQGYDEEMLQVVKEHLKLTDEQAAGLKQRLREANRLALPYPFLPLQDCVDVCILLIKTTINMQRFTVDLRGVGGPIDVATITRTDGFCAVQQKVISGERS